MIPITQTVVDIDTVMIELVHTLAAYHAVKSLL